MQIGGLATLILVAAAVSAPLQTAFAADTQSSRECLKVLKPLAVGDVPSEDAFQQVDCAATALPSAFRRDAGMEFSRATRALGVGDVVPTFPEFGQDLVRPGQMLAIVIAIGPVRVARDVQAMQAARPGQRLFVRSADGEIFSARYEPSPAGARR